MAKKKDEVEQKVTNSKLKEKKEAKEDTQKVEEKKTEKDEADESSAFFIRSKDRLFGVHDETVAIHGRLERDPEERAIIGLSGIFAGFRCPHRSATGQRNCNCGEKAKGNHPFHLKNRG